MSTLGTELRKEKRTGIFPVLLSTGILGALYALFSFLVRRDSLMNLEMNPMDVLLTQLYGMIMVLNLFGIVIGACMMYNMEFKEHAIQKMDLLPISRGRIYWDKFVILTGLLLTAVVLENLSLIWIGKQWLGAGTFEMSRVLEFGLYSFLTSMPVLSFMLFVSSRCKNSWISLGIGIGGFLSAMALSGFSWGAVLIHPFVIMLRPAMAMNAGIETGTAAAAAAETIFFLGLGLFGKGKTHE